MRFDDFLLRKGADNIRWLSAAMPQVANSGHPGGPMGGADFIHLLYSEYLVYDPQDPLWTERDRFYLDPGHMSPMLYATLATMGHYSLEDLSQFRRWGSHTPGHPEHDPAHGVENTSGPLGQGHVFGVGAAVAERFLAARFGDWLSHKTWVYISDGGIQEEISQGAGRIAGHLGLSSLVMFYDANDVQLSHKVSATTSEDTAAKYRAWGWVVHEVDGHDYTQMRAALDKASVETAGPTLIIGKTVMGKGARKADGSVWEGDVKQHGAPFGEASTKATVAALGGDPENPIQLLPEVLEGQKRRQAELSQIVAKRREAKAQWAKANADKADLYAKFFAQGPWNVGWDDISFGDNLASRNANAKVLERLAERVPNMVCMSADLADSDKSEAFLKKTGAFVRGDFSGAFLQVGVAELTMAAIAVGMSLHGGVFPVCSTFFSFSDYMKPVLRMAALQETRVVFFWTHDSFRVGEDGPTHQPIEHEAQLRLLEQMKNLSGRRSLLVLRPGDSAEVREAWRLSLENLHGPSAMIFSRQDLLDLPTEAIHRAENAVQSARGGYVVSGQNPRLVLLANGSELGLAHQVAEILRAEGVATRVASLPSIGLFLEQDEAYRRSVLPLGVPVLALTAGLPSVFQGLEGPLGEVFGLARFGASANFKVLDEKFGFTPVQVAERARKLLAGLPAKIKALRELAELAQTNHR
ncbi:MAG: transketolase [Fibrobacterota bacterium]|nr:transketolase [Fibrobacterota bacterium]QQS06497.1 MAG: transketolase [Fibrobacterota bacterium]